MQAQAREESQDGAVVIYPQQGSNQHQLQPVSASVVHDYLEHLAPEIDAFVNLYGFRSLQVTNNNYFGKGKWGSAYGRMVALFITNKMINALNIQGCTNIRFAGVQITDGEGDIHGVNLQTVLDWLGVKVKSHTFINWRTGCDLLTRARVDLMARSASPSPSPSWQASEPLNKWEQILYENLCALCVPQDAIKLVDDPNGVPHLRLGLLPDVQGINPGNNLSLVYPGVTITDAICLRASMINMQDIEKEAKDYLEHRRKEQEQ